MYGIIKWTNVPNVYFGPEKNLKMSLVEFSKKKSGVLG